MTGRNKTKATIAYWAKPENYCAVEFGMPEHLGAVASCRMDLSRGILIVQTTAGVPFPTRHWQESWEKE